MFIPFVNSDAPPGRLLIVAGPTAAGKTRLSLELARRFDGEIVSADSRLFYRGLNIGTAKPNAAERALVPHHLIDICDLGETVSLAQFQQAAYAAIDDIVARGRLPILVGGTGQYVMALIEGWGIPEVAPRPRLRRALSALGEGEAIRWLAALDPLAAERIDSRNLRRVVRALEVTLTTGRRMTDLQRKSPPPYNSAIIGLTLDRDTLYARIDERVDRMMEQGLLAELEVLLAGGLNRRAPALSSLGYRQLLAYLDGDISLEAAVERIKYETHRFARQQATWFRPDDPRIAWFDATDPDALARQATAYAQIWLSDAKSAGPHNL